MKNLIYTFLLSLLAYAAVNANDPVLSNKDRNEKKIARQEAIKEAVESKRFTIQLDRLYLPRYGLVNLFPGANFIIVDRTRTAISAGYMGRQYGIFPVSGIRLSGEPSVYKMLRNDSKGNYKIELEVKGTSDTFHVTMVISENGYCSAMISGSKIDGARYSGELVPIEKDEEVREPDAIKI